jgi:hypothetical protein
MIPKIIRGLWGDITQRKGNRQFRYQRDLVPHFELLATICNALATQQPVNQVYCYGRDNALFLRGLGLPTRYLSSDAWGTPRLDHEQYREALHWAVVWGASTWQHKLKIIRHALQEHESVLWVDWRVELVQPDRLAAWMSDLSNGPEFRACLIRQRSTGWGARWRYLNGPLLPGVAQLEPVIDSRGRVTLPHAHDVVGGGLLYVRGAEGLRLIDTALAVYNEYPRLTDQQALAAAVDRLHGKWIGIVRWFKHYELSGYYYSRNRWYTAPEDTVWRCGEHLTKQDHRHQLWR